MCNVAGLFTHDHTLNSAYNEVTLNEKMAIMKEKLCTKYTPFTYKCITLNKKPPIMKQNLSIFFFVIGGVECISIMWNVCTHLLLMTLLIALSSYDIYIYWESCLICAHKLISICDIAFEWLICCWYVYCYIMLNKNCSLVLFLTLMCSRVGLHVDYSIGAVGHTYAMWQACLFRDICQ